MKAIFFALFMILAVTTAKSLNNVEGRRAQRLVGSNRCTWGPGYFCHNITNSAECNSTQHCIKKYWEVMKVPDDHDSVCDICKQMVEQARDQLESNQTQQDLKAVFEGSCKLMIIEPVVKECDRLVDQFIPELIETLASQMNPSVVCSVSGLCNSPKIDQYIKEHEKNMRKNLQMTVVSLKNDELQPDLCTGCYTIATHMTDKFQAQSKDHLVNEWLSICRLMDSFSDACSSLVIVNFETIYNHLKENLNAKNVCHLSGQCVARFHQHEDDEITPAVEIRPLSSVGMVEVKDDLPCKLCEQLVGHLRDLLVANTTEDEFKKVLDGFCKQTKSFSSECISIVDQYYPEIYEFLTKRLDGNTVCEMGGICPEPDKRTSPVLVMPMLPANAVEIGVKIMKQEKRKNLGEHGSGIRKIWPKTEADEMQLPIERLGVQPSILQMPNMDVKGQETCAFCEYLLHYLQQIITTPTTEDEMKQLLGKVCKKLPNSVEGTCIEFLNTYGDAFIAVFVEEIDPSVICPMIHICPSTQDMDLWEKLPKDLMLKSEVEDKPSCPLCLLAIEQLYQAIKNDKTEKNIQQELEKLCSHLPKELHTQCNSFVEGYSKELIEMLIADMTPQEVCVYIKFCDANKNVGPSLDFFPLDKNGEIMTNEIPDFPVAPVKPAPKNSEACVLCEYFIEYVEKEMKSKTTKDEIEHIVHSVCNKMPKKISDECNTFVDGYGDLIITLLSSEVSPQEVCTLMKLCKGKFQQIVDSISECALCQALVSSLDTVLTEAKVDDEIEKLVGKACKYVPASKQGKCNMMLEVYEQSIINLLVSHAETRNICSKLTLCSSSDFFAMSHQLFRDRRHNDFGTKPCTWGKVYMCQSLETAAECKAEAYCRKNVWNGEFPPSDFGGTSTSTKTRFLTHEEFAELD